MKIDLDQMIKNLRNEPIIDQDNVPLTLKSICMSALLVDPSPDERIPDKDKYERYKLAMRIETGGVQDLSVEDISKIKAIIGKLFPTYVMGRCWDMLEGIYQENI